MSPVQKMESLELFHSSILSKTLSLLSPLAFPKPPLPPSLFPPTLRSLSLSPLALSLPKRSFLPHCFSRSPHANQQQEEQGKEELEEEELEEFGEDEEEGDEAKGEDFSDVDVDALEEEARYAFHQYSSSLSRELRIGQSGIYVLCDLSMYCVCVFIYACVCVCELISEDEADDQTGRNQKRGRRKTTTTSVSSIFLTSCYRNVYLRENLENTKFHYLHISLIFSVIILKFTAELKENHKTFQVRVIEFLF